MGINWDICPICNFDIYNNKMYIHTKIGNCHLDCLVDFYVNNKNNSYSIIANLYKNIIKSKVGGSKKDKKTCRIELFPTDNIGSEFIKLFKSIRSSYGYNQYVFINKKGNIVVKVWCGY